MAMATRTAGAAATARTRRLSRGVLVAVALVVAAAVAFRIFAGGALRGWAETRLNEELQGYRVELPELRIDVLRLGLQLLGLTLRQEANPEPPVARIERLGLSLSWTALLRGRLLAELELESPRLHVDRGQVVEEAKDEEDIEDRGWQEALFAIYPLEIDRLQVDDGALSYVDEKGGAPLRFDRVELTARDIRNVRSAAGAYPSPISMRARVFESGELRVDGGADLLATPHAAVDVDVELETVPLQALAPLADEIEVRIRDGVLGATGHVEYAAAKKEVYLRRVRVDGVRVDYVEAAGDSEQERLRGELAEDAARVLSESEATRIYVDLLEIRGSELAYDREDRDYRLFVSAADVTIEDVVNRDADKRASLDASGRFMGSGDLKVSGSYHSGRETPDFDVDLRIERTPLTELNDVFESHAGFDVHAGTFAFYSELVAEDGRLRGYVKPLFEGMDVYDREQDREKSVLGELYEGVVGGAAKLLENPSDDVAARAEVSGRIDAPDVSTWDTVVSIVRNAFIDAIAPGIEGTEGQPPPPAES